MLSFIELLVYEYCNLIDLAFPRKEKSNSSPTVSDQRFMFYTFVRYNIVKQCYLFAKVVKSAQTSINTRVRRFKIHFRTFVYSQYIGMSSWRSEEEDNLPMGTMHNHLCSSHLIRSHPRGILFDV